MPTSLGHSPLWDDAADHANELAKQADWLHKRLIKTGRVEDPLAPLAEAQTLHAAALALVDSLAAIALLNGASLRQTSRALGLAPNTLAGRMAHTAELAAYAEDGRVRDEGLARARWDASRNQLNTHKAIDPLNVAD